jgi:hypothetical protein
MHMPHVQQDVRVAQWRPVQGFESLYEVSDSGEVRRLVAAGPYHLSTNNLNNYGYPMVGLYKDSKLTTTAIHRLVASAFCSRADGCNDVNHKDGNKTNNTAANLEWVTKQQNNAHAAAMGLMRRGKRNKPKPVAELGSIAELLRQVDAKALAAEAGVNIKTIYRLRHGENSPRLELVERLVAACRKLKGRKA